MRVTVNLGDGLLAAARRLAAEERRTLGSVLDDALGLMFNRRERSDEHPFRLTAFGGSGVQPGVGLDNNAALLNLMEGRAAAP